MTNNDQVILDLKKQVEEKKKELKSSEKFVPETNCNLIFNGERYNIHILDKDTLLFLIASLGAMQDAINNRFLGEDVTIGGYKISAWLNDLKSKFIILNRKMEERRLKELETKLHNLLSQDKKIELEIEDIKKSI